MSEIVVNTTTAGVQHQPATAALGNTHFFVVWEDGSDLTIKGQIIQANGNKSGGEFVISTTPTGENTKVQLPTIASSGPGPIVAWIEDALNPPGPRPHVKLQKFDRDGNKRGGQIQVSTTDVDPNHRPALTGTIDGGFLVSWVDARRDQRIRARRFDFDGSPEGDEFKVNTTDGFHEAPIVARLDNGNHVIAWRSDPSPAGGGALIFRIFDLEGSPVVGETRPNVVDGFRGAKAMTILPNGRFVIAHVMGLPLSDLGEPRGVVHANVFEPDGTSASIPIFATSGQEINCSSPTLAPLSGGRFLLAWTQKRADTFETTPSVRARVFAVGQGEPVGQEVGVNTTTPDERFSVFRVSAATIFVPGEREAGYVAWADNRRKGEDTSDFAVRGRELPILPSGGVG